MTAGLMRNSRGRTARFSFLLSRAGYPRRGALGCAISSWAASRHPTWRLSSRARSRPPSLVATIAFLLDYVRSAICASSSLPLGARRADCGHPFHPLQNGTRLAGARSCFSASRASARHRGFAPERSFRPFVRGKAPLHENAPPGRRRASGVLAPDERRER